MHARQIRPDTRPTDRRRLAAATLSAVLPGVGQAVTRRTQLALLLLVPSVLLLLVGLVVIQLQSPARLVAWIVAPQVMATLLTLNLVVLAWRLVSVGQAFLDTRWTGSTGRLGVGGIVVLALLVALPHVVVYRYGTIVGDTFSRIFQAPVSPTTRASRPDPCRPTDSGSTCCWWESTSFPTARPR